MPMTHHIIRLLFVAILAVCSACSGYNNAPATGSQPTPQSGASASGDLQFKTPQGWIAERPSSSMRQAQYKLPRAEGDPEDAELAVFYFGPGQGGPVQANLDRWIGQMEQPDGSSSRDNAKTETLTVNGLKTTLLDVSGRYTAEMSPGSGSRFDKPNYRMRAAVIETPKGAYFIKLVGPEKTIARWEPEFMQFVNSVEFK